MKLLITGATGLVGSEIADRCREQDIAVNYLTTSREKITSSPHYKGFYWNPAENQIDLACFDGVSAIINLAGVSIAKRWTASHRKKIVQSRVQSLRTLETGLQKVASGTIRSLVSASAIGIYPDASSEYYTEESPGRKDDFLGHVVRSWEQEADRFRKFGFPVAKIRIGLVLSSRGGALPAFAKPIKYYLGSAFGNGEQWQSWIHIRDLSRIFLFAVSQALEGTYNAVGPNPVTQNKLIHQLAKTLDKPLLLPNIPEIILKTALGEMSQVVLDSQRVSSKKLEEAGYNFEFQNVCTALENIYHKDEPLGKDNSIEREFI